MVFNEKLREIKIGITTIVASKWIVGYLTLGIVSLVTLHLDHRSSYLAMRGLDRHNASLWVTVVFSYRKLQYSSVYRSTTSAEMREPRGGGGR